MIVSNAAWIRNQVMIQNDRGLEKSHQRKRLGASGVAPADHAISAAIGSVAASRAHTLSAARSAVRTAVTTANIRKRCGLFRTHSPSAWMLTLKYGITISAITTSVGISTPPTTGGK